MTSYVKRVGDLTDPENFEKAVAEASKNGELDNFDVSKLTSCDINGSTINPCGYDPVTKPSHYVDAWNRSVRVPYAGMRVQVHLAMARQERHRRPQEGTRVHRQHDPRD